MAWEHDAATAAAIVATQLKDLEELNGGSDNDTDGDSNDAVFARQIYQEDLERHVATLHDHQIATLFGESPLENEDLPSIPLPSIVNPHLLDRTENLKEDPETSFGHHKVEQQAERRVLSPILGLLARKRKASDSPPPTCKALKLSDHTVDDPVCTACMSPILPSDLIHLSCDHNYCMECTMRLFTTAMTDETLFPPQCCGISIPLANVRSEVDAEFEEAFKKRQVELSTPASERTYCASQTCSFFLGSRTEGLQEDKVHCPKCNTDTCTTCKGVAHESSYCPQDPSIVSLMATAASQGYKQCPSCHLVIELTFGCHHMTCRCKNQFCFNCLTAWKECPCDMWDEDRLLQRATMLIDRDGPQPLVLPRAIRDERIREATRNLRENHGCTHNDSWTKLYGFYQCENCLYELYVYIFECSDCRLRVCRWCREGDDRPRYRLRRNN